ncbi:MAG: hypothetical protein R6V01_08345 [Thermoplasmatota archaeon]
MEIFDLKKIQKGPDRKKSIILFEKDGIKLRKIILGPDEKIPACDMTTRVIFHVVEGSVEIIVNGEVHNLQEGFCLTTEPATISMRSEKGSGLLGIQIA